MNKCCIINYDLGFIEGSDDQYYTDRIAAFGAIRRAATVMRAYEAVGWKKLDGLLFVDDMNAVVAEAAVRRAIRAAIGSPKA